MRKMIMSLALILSMCFLCNTGSAQGWEVPGGPDNENTSCEKLYYTGYGMKAKLIEDLATRSGPSTQYTGCGYYQMNGESVRVISRAFDNGGVQWVLVEFAYGGAIRRAYTGAIRLNLTANQLAMLPEEDMTEYIGYGTVDTNVNPKWGPGDQYTTYTERTIKRGSRVAVISYENGYYMVESYHTDGNVLRSWIPVFDVILD